MTVTLEGTKDADLLNWMAHQGERVERALDRVLPAATPAGTGADDLHEAMRYAVLGGGKRVRPLLVYAAGEVSGARQEVLDGSACAVELIHAYSLVHDDMPCMDDDDVRRGKPTVHKRYGEAHGDAGGRCAAGAGLRGAGGAAAGPRRRTMPIRCRWRKWSAHWRLRRRSLGMAGGQALDLAAVGTRLDRVQLEAMHQKKTGAMLAAAVRLGMLCGGRWCRPPLRQVAAYSASVGLAFQVVDDILDVTADSTTLGKTAGKDQAQDKPTYVSILGLAQSQALARQLGQRAAQAAQSLGARGAAVGANWPSSSSTGVN